MGRLHRFPDHRFIGRRDLMVVFDCDDQAVFGELEASVRGLDLDGKNLLQAFAPDDLAEAANRGFKPQKRVGGN
jgi:hypothetical protein